MKPLTIKQPAVGYRFTRDSLALADFVDISAAESLLDLGTGVGVVPLRLWQRSSFHFAVGVELQKDLADLATHNVTQNGLGGRIKILHKDILSLESADFGSLGKGDLCRGFEVISANPPFYPLGGGRLNPNRQKAIARHEVHLKLPQLVTVCHRWLKLRGRLYLIHAVQRETEVRSHLERQGSEVTRRVLLHSRVLFEAARQTPEWS